MKNLIGVLSSLSFLIFISVYSPIYINSSFSSFKEELKTLYAKTEKKEATAEDALAVKMSWQSKKNALHIWIPHNDVSYIDYWLNEATGLIYVECYELALPKITVLLEICDAIPKGYTFSTENIF